jgi:small-conductance mechanosensitive channel
MVISEKTASKWSSLPPHLLQLTAPVKWDNAGARPSLLGLVLTILAIAGLIASMIYVLSTQLVPPGLYGRALLGMAVLAAGLLATRALSGYLIRALYPSMGQSAVTLANVIKVVGYAGSGLASLSLFLEAGIGALAGGTFAGLVVGLAAQQTLGNFFAGLYILLTRFVEPGKEVRLLTSQVPFQPVLFPPYKHFSADYLLMGFRGVVREVGLFYTSIETETGLLLKMPNSIIIASAVVHEGDSGEGLYSVRYEFSEELDPELVLEKVRQALGDLAGVREVYINEQSDKNFYIVRVNFSCTRSEDWRALKSEILKRLIKLNTSLRARRAEPIPGS